MLTKGKEDLETGALKLDDLSADKLPLVVGLLLLHLKFQTDSLISSDVYEPCCTAVLQTKGSSALCTALNVIIDTNLKPSRRRALREFLRYLWLLQSHKQNNGLDSIALATRFGNYLIRPPSGTEPVLSRVKLMGALAILIEAGPGKGAAGATPAGAAALPPMSAVPSALATGTPSPVAAMAKQASHNELPTAAQARVRTLSTSADNAPTGPRQPVRPPPAAAATGMQTVDIARSAVIVIDRFARTQLRLRVDILTNDIRSAQKSLTKLQTVRGCGRAACLSAVVANGALTGAGGDGGSRAACGLAQEAQLH